MDTVSDPHLPILIVDDSSQYTAVLQKMLSSGFGYENVTWIESPEEALERLKEEGAPWKLLFIDFNFPGGMSGGRLLQELQFEGALEGRIAFLITSDPTPENMQEATTAGALGVIAKPFDREALRKQLEKAENHLRTENMEGF